MNNRLWAPSLLHVLLLFLLLGLIQAARAQDYDGDGIDSSIDNCPATPNPDQIDSDGNGVGNACEQPVAWDTDSDLWPDNIDNCPSNRNYGQFDYDKDGQGDYCDNTTTTEYIYWIIEGDTVFVQQNTYSTNCSGKTCFNLGDQFFGGSSCYCQCYNSYTGSSCERLGSYSTTAPWAGDLDQDGILDVNDNAPYVSNADQADSDGDGIGDVSDNCVFGYNPSQTDSDGDGVGDGCASVFPVELLYFRGEFSGNGIQLQWETAWEHNNHAFRIDKSRDGRSFSPWQTIPAAGESAEPVAYEVVDPAPDNQLFHYYRLTQIDLDGQARIVGTVHLDSRPNQNLMPALKVYPNPLEGHHLQVLISDPFAGRTQGGTVRLFREDGRLVWAQAYPASQEAVALIGWDLPQRLTSGQYLLTVTTEFWQQSAQILVK